MNNRQERLMEAFQRAVLEDKEELGFYPSIFAQTSLPYKDPQDVKFWSHTNGDVTLTVNQGVIAERDGEAKAVGYPYGALPRLIILYLATEAVKTKQQEIPLGDNISDFLRQLGKGSDTRARKRLVDQARRLFSCTFQFSGMRNGVLYGKNMPLVTDYQLWIGDGKDNNAPDLFAAKVRLNDDFFKEFTSKGAFPINVEQLKGLSKSPLAIDVYMWLIRRMCSLKEPVNLRWELLEAQFGGQYSNKKKFRENLRKELNGIQIVWPELKVEFWRGGMTLKPSELPVRKLT